MIRKRSDDVHKVIWLEPKIENCNNNNKNNEKYVCVWLFTFLVGVRAFVTDTMWIAVKSVPVALVSYSNALIYI